MVITVLDMLMSLYFPAFTGNLWSLFLLVTIMLIAIELVVRTLLIGRLEPNINNCPTRQIPRLIWKVLTHSQIEIFSALALLMPERNRNTPR